MVQQFVIHCLARSLNALHPRTVLDEFCRRGRDLPNHGLSAGSLQHEVIITIRLEFEFNDRDIDTPDH